MTQPATPPPVRKPLGRRDRAEVGHTVLRVVGRESKTPVLDVAAFQSFTD
jgi:hypothetical protein